MTEVDEFTPAECFQIDPEGKNVLFVHYPENISSSRWEGLRDAISQIQRMLNEWAKEPDDPIYVLCLPWDVKIKIGKIQENQDSKQTNKAENLLDQLYQWVGYNYAVEHEDFNICFFCDEKYPGHTDDCPYMNILKYMGQKK